MCAVLGGVLLDSGGNWRSRICAGWNNRLGMKGRSWKSPSAIIRRSRTRIGYYYSKKRISIANTANNQLPSPSNTTIKYQNLRGTTMHKSAIRTPAPISRKRGQDARNFHGPFFLIPGTRRRPQHRNTQLMAPSPEIPTASPGIGWSLTIKIARTSNCCCRRGVSQNRPWHVLSRGVFI